MSDKRIDKIGKWGNDDGADRRKDRKEADGGNEVGAVSSPREIKANIPSESQLRPEL